MPTYDLGSITNDYTLQINDNLTGHIEYKDNLYSVITSNSLSYTGLTSTNVRGGAAWYPVNTYDWSFYIDGIESDYEKCTSFRFRTRRKRLCLKFKI